MADWSDEEVQILVQHAIVKYENEDQLLDKLGPILDGETIQRTIDTLIGTQKVRRIGPENLQNNESHTEVPELPDNLRPVVEGL